MAAVTGGIAARVTSALRAHYWDWPTVRGVSCIAEDSYGDRYRVSEVAVSGFGLANMTELEDEALDRCYAESGQDLSCFLASCSHN